MRSRQEIRRIVEGFASSGKTRRDYCEEHGISITTLDHGRRKQGPKPKLMEVAIEPQQPGRKPLPANLPRVTIVAPCQAHLRGLRG